MTFTSEARRAAEQWKQSTECLPDDARTDGPYRAGGRAYRFCLPEAFRSHNLLPDARAVGLDRFAAAGIPWHKGASGLPCTHLLSSQVQCVNALAPMIRNPTAIKEAFGGVLDIATPLPVGDVAFDPGDPVAFEWIGLANYLQEWGPKPPTRGANVTSADAVIRYETSDGNIEVALIEWKYTEQYHGKALESLSKTQQIRIPRYRQAFEDGPLRTDSIPYESLFVEPLYQLMRQQLLAREMEKANELGATRVRVVYAAPGRNAELWSSLLPMHRDATGKEHLRDVWQLMLRDRFADRFVFLDTATLVADSAPTSAEFRARYGHLAG